MVMHLRKLWHSRTDRFCTHKQYFCSIFLACFLFFYILTVYTWHSTAFRCTVKYYTHPLDGSVRSSVIYLSAGGCRPVPRCDGARWSGCPPALCPSSRTETWSSAADCGSGSPSSESRRCCKHPAGRTGGGTEKKRTKSIVSDNWLFANGPVLVWFQLFS